VNFKHEIYRKFVHYSSSIFPVCYYFYLDRDTMLWILGSCTILIVTGEIMRFIFPFFTNLYGSLFGEITRNSENNSFTGATYTLFGFLLCTFLFSKEIAVFAMLIQSLGDSTAALVGIRWGTVKIINKSLQGSLTFLLISLGIVFLLNDLPRPAGIVSSVIATIVELLPSPFNDNLMVPLSVGFTMSIMNFIV